MSIERKRLARFLRKRADECFTDARKATEDALAQLVTAIPAMDHIEQDLADALLHIGEARGFYNAAVDVDDREDEAESCA